METMRRGLDSRSRFIKLEEGTRFLIYCNTCRTPLMLTKVDPDTHPVLHRLARSSSFYHRRAYASRHIVEKINLQTGHFAVIS